MCIYSVFHMNGVRMHTHCLQTIIMAVDNHKNKIFEENERQEESLHQYGRKLAPRPPANGESIYFYCSVVGTVWFVASLVVLGLLAYGYMSRSSQLGIAMNEYKHCQAGVVQCREQYKDDLEEHKKRYQTDLKRYKDQHQTDLEGCKTQCKADLEEWKKQYKFEREHSIKQEEEKISRTDECSVTKSNLSGCDSERYYSRIIIGVLCCILLTLPLVCCEWINHWHNLALKASINHPKKSDNSVPRCKAI